MRSEKVKSAYPILEYMSLKIMFKQIKIIWRWFLSKAENSFLNEVFGIFRFLPQVYSNWEAIPFESQLWNTK